MLIAGAMAPSLWAQEEDLVPLSDLKPLEVSKDVLNLYGISYGLSINQTFYHDTNIDQYMIMGAYRPYLMALIMENHLLTIRGRANHTHFEKKISNRKQDELIGALEVFSADVRIGNRISLKLGRSFFKLGRGLLFANFADGMQFDHSLGKWGQYRAFAIFSGQYGSDLCYLSVQGCGSATNPFNIVPGQAADANIADAGKRLFYALEYTTPEIILGTRFWMVAMLSQDMNKGTKANGEKYTYNPFYGSLGARGLLPLRGMRYMASYYYQGGETSNQCQNSSGTVCSSTITGTTESAKISAQAITADINYSLPFLGKLIQPTASLQYAFASGDSDRKSGGLAAQANTAGSDQGFYYFGAYSAGLALKPRLQNMHIARAGVSFRPLYSMYAFRNLLISFKYSYYQKAIASAPTSDPNVESGSSAKSNLGNGFDLTLVWSFRSDVKLFYGLGVFKPGDAYKSGNKDTLMSHLVSLTINL